MSYLRLIRFKIHVTFIAVIIGALVFAPTISLSLLKPLFLLYLSFNVLLYGGIYTLNDIADIELDRKHSLKKKRPLPSGEISILSALVFAIILISLAFLSGAIFFKAPIMIMYFIFLVLNLFYTFIAKKIPYLELVTNATTNALRFPMGILLVKGDVPYLLLLAFFFLALGIASVKRKIEMDAHGLEGRPVLKFYSENQLVSLQLLSFLAILLLLIIDAKVSKVLYFIIAAFYMPAVFGAYFRPVKTFIKELMFV